jgi:RNA polymerase-binding protein DksA
MGLSKEKIEYFREKLEEEKVKLESGLKNIGRKNPDIAGDWEVMPADLNINTADKNELADAFEELENRSAIEDSLEERLMFVNKALENIKKGKYGVCGECGKPIDLKRLEANPAANKCIKHAAGR